MNDAKRTPRSISFNPGPISGVLFYRNGSAVVKRINLNPDKEEVPERGDIKKLSRKSLTRLAFYAVETEVHLKSMITLTYGANWPKDGKTVKKHLNTFLVVARRRGIIGDYIWFLEFQKRGAPHIHILSSIPAGSGGKRSVLAMEWALIATEREYIRYCDIVTRETINLRAEIYSVHKHKKAWQNERKPGGTKRYAIKYSMKTYQKDVPANYANVGRFWGMSRRIANSIEEGYEVTMRETELRQLLTKTGHRTANWDILPRYIFAIA